MRSKGLLRWLAGCYLSLTIAVVIARQVLDAGSWIRWLLDHNLALLFFPLPVVLLLVILTRDRKALALIAPPALAFLFLYGRLLLPQARPEAPAVSIPLSVMTYNVLFSNTDLTAVAGVILGAGVDLVGVQELTRGNAPALNRLLADELPYHTEPPDGQSPQVALFSRYPILAAEQFGLPFGDRSWSAQVDVHGITIQVIVIHLVPTRLPEVPIGSWPERIDDRQSIRMEQLDRVIDAVHSRDDPVIVLCDCNFSEFSEAYARLGSVLNDSFAEAGWGLGNTSHFAGVGYFRIDYVWVSRGFIPITAWVAGNGGSDHYPLVVELSLPTR